jgi:hypothetical protein
MANGDDHETPGAVRAAWRAEEAEWSRAAHERWEHDRAFVDVLRDCMHRGDAVACDLGCDRCTGTVASVGVDVARIATTDGSVDVRIDATAPIVVRVVAPARRGGHRGDSTTTTFVARLRQLERSRVRLGLRGDREPLEGALLVGLDQVSVIDGDGRRAYVPIGSVCWVRPVDVD